MVVLITFIIFVDPSIWQYECDCIDMSYGDVNRDSVSIIDFFIPSLSYTRNNNNMVYSVPLFLSNNIPGTIQVGWIMWS